MPTTSRIAIAVALAFLSSALVYGRQAAYAQTQSDMDQSTLRDFEKADNELNVLYQKLLKQYDPKDESEAKTRKKIILAERARMKYRRGG